jgi:hypothetical protein
LPIRRLLKQVGLGASLLAGLYLAGANLALNSGAAERLLSRRPQRVRFTWTRAWSLYPGHLAARGLRIEGRVRSRRWEVAADRVTARFDVWPLARREFRAPRLAARGARTRVWREAPPPAGPDRAARPSEPRPRRRRWLFRFDDVTVEDVRTVEIQGFSAVCGGRADGAFRFSPGREVAVERGTLSCPAAELAAAGRTFARQVRLDAIAELAAYSPREHPGVKGFDFLSGQLHARGRAEPMGSQHALAMGVLTAAGDLEADLVLAAGRLLPGTRVELASADGAATLGLTVAGAPPATVLSVRAPRLELPGPAGQPPFLTTGPISLAASTPETRLSHLLAVERHLRRERELPEAYGLTGELEAETVRLDARGAAHWMGEADLVRGRVDLGGLFHRRLALDGLRARGVAVRWRKGTAAPGAAAGRRWDLAIRDAEIAELRELEIGELRLLGPARLAVSATFTPEQGFELERALFEGPAVRIHDGEHEVARALQLHAEAAMAPVRFGETTARQALRSTSGTLTVAGQVASLGFLGRFLQRAPWLRIDGQGQLYGELKIQNGKLEPGSEWRLEKATLRAKILDDLATGDATLQGGVRPGRRGPEAIFDARFRRFKFAPDQPGNPAAYLRGDQLRIHLVSRDVDLAERVENLNATVAMDNAQVPDLKAYNSYLPPAAGVAIRSGSGRLRLNWKLDLATQRGTGKIVLDSPRIAVRFQDVDLAGRLRLDASLAAADLRRRRFDLTGSELRLDDVVFREIGSDGGGGAEGWWARLRLTGGSFQWQRPMTLTSAVELEMKDSGFLLSLFTRKKQKLGWFAKVLDVEGVVARGQVRLDPSGLQIDGLRAVGGPLDLRARLRLGKGNRRGDLYVSYGALAAGVALRDGQRDMKLIRPLAWFESRPALGD